MKKNRKVTVLKNREEIKKAEEFLNDGYQEKWEQGQLGQDPKHAVMTQEGLSGAPTTIRLPASMKTEISQIAHSKGLTVNSYIRMLIADHLKNHKKAS